MLRRLGGASQVQGGRGVKLFGREIAIRRKGCCFDGEPGTELVPSVTLYVKVTNACPCACPFCSNAEHAGEDEGFDLQKLLQVVREIKLSGLELTRVCVTGGEPSAAVDRVLPLLEALSDFEFKDVRLQLNTNGISRRARDLMRHPRWTLVAMSMHHYDLAMLGEIYGVRDPIEPFDLKDIGEDRLYLNCNLVRGYVDSTDKVMRLLAFAETLGAGEVGFETLRQVNAFCRERFVGIDSLDVESRDHVHRLAERTRGNACHCRNYLFAGRESNMRFYLRELCDYSSSESTLLYDGRFLCQGFGAKSVIC